ncbi:MAG: hypothetical protein ACREQC_00825, partial [Candidatus Binataceae bacterium]
MDLRWPNLFLPAMWRIVLRLERSVWSWLELIGEQLIVRIEVECDAGSGGLKRFRIDMAHHGDHGIPIGRILEEVAT